MQKYDSILTLVGRIALGAIFIVFGIIKISAFAGMVAFATAAGIPFPTIAIVGAIAIELLGGIMIVVGYKTKWTALAIALFLIPVTYYFHRDFADQINMTMFLKISPSSEVCLSSPRNGAGAFSLDSVLKRK